MSSKSNVDISHFVILIIPLKRIKGYAWELFRLWGETAWRGGRTGPEVVPGATRWIWNSAEIFRVFDHTAPTPAPQRYNS